MIEDKKTYDEQLISKIKDIEIGLIYYIKRNKELEQENQNLKKMYKNRVNEFIKLSKEKSNDRR